MFVVIDHDSLCGSTITDGDSHRGSCNSHGDSVYEVDLSDGDLRVLEEYRIIVKHFNDLRKDLVVAQLVRDYFSSETDLVCMRDTYFRSP